MIQQERLQSLNDCPIMPGKYVLYWMQQAQRAEGNHALEFAIREANRLSLPVVALFGVTDSYPEASERHYAFLLEGLCDVEKALRRRNIQLVVRHESPERAAVRLSEEAALLITDRGYLRIQRTWRQYVSEHVRCQMMQAETDVIVPVETAAEKEQFSAATLRPKIHRLLANYLVPLEESLPNRSSLSLAFDSPERLDIHDVDGALARLNIDRSVGRISGFKGGSIEANRWLDLFVESKLEFYATKRNDPTQDYSSHLSPYLHYGQISPLKIALRLRESELSESRDAFLEEMIVRRELSMNFVFYNPSYDQYVGLPDWAKKTLEAHREDKREHEYTLEEWERAETHDPYWNAAQQEMVLTGKMHNYMRMYWGKKILEWSRTPEEAFQTALILNNRYELDGRDANSFTGVAWCFGKHDRPWGERKVFGMVRYMNAGGLRRKFPIDTYVKNIDCLLR